MAQVLKPEPVTIFDQTQRERVRETFRLMRPTFGGRLQRKASVRPKIHPRAVNPR